MSGGPHHICVNRLQKEYLALNKNKDIVDIFTAKPSTNNILEWHYVIYGQKNSHYQGGYYHGMVVFPLEYPHKPPSLLMITPSGRFICNSRICTSMSDFHPESWSPFWTVVSIVLGLVSFMNDDEVGFGSIVKSKETRQQYAAASMAFNLKNPTFVKLFPEVILDYKKKLSELPSSSKLPSSLPTTTTTTTTKTTKTTSTSTPTLNNDKLTNTTIRKKEKQQPTVNNNDSSTMVIFISIIVVLIAMVLFYFIYMK